MYDLVCDNTMAGLRPNLINRINPNDRKGPAQMFVDRTGARHACEMLLDER